MTRETPGDPIDRSPAGPDPDDDRRRSYRADVRGLAVLHAPGDAGRARYHIENLSLGGARLRRAAGTTPPPLPVGAAVTVELGVDGTGWVVQQGQILRSDRDALAIGFGPLTPEAEDLIEDEVLAAIEARRAPRVVVVDRSAPRRLRLAAALERGGLCALEASTPLEAIDLVERSRTHVAVAAIHETLTQTGGWELIAYLGDAHPQLKIAVIADDELAATRSPGRGVDAVIVTDRGDPAAAVRQLVSAGRGQA